MTFQIPPLIRVIADAIYYTAVLVVASVLVGGLLAVVLLDDTDPQVRDAAARVRVAVGGRP